jgi:hypothetical protein
MTVDVRAEGPVKGGRGSKVCSHVGPANASSDAEGLTGFRSREPRDAFDDVAAALLSDPGVSAAAALTVPSHEEADDLLVAFVTGDFSGDPSDRLRALVAGRLPPDMTPSSIVVADALPRTRDGEIDRKALAVAFAARSHRLRAEGEPPAPGLEAEVAAIWSDLLGAQDIRRTDRFFALGGTSIKALLFTARLSKQLGADIPLPLLQANDELRMFCAACTALIRGT